MSYLKGYTRTKLKDISRETYTNECDRKNHVQLETDVTEFKHGIIKSKKSDDYAMKVDDDTDLDAKYKAELETKQALDSIGWFDEVEIKV